MGGGWGWVAGVLLTVSDLCGWCNTGFAFGCGVMAWIGALQGFDFVGVTGGFSCTFGVLRG